MEVLLKKTIVDSVEITGHLEVKLSSLFGRSKEEDQQGSSFRYWVRIGAKVVALVGVTRNLNLPKRLI